MHTMGWRLRWHTKLDNQLPSPPYFPPFAQPTKKQKTETMASINLSLFVLQFYSTTDRAVDM